MAVRMTSRPKNANMPTSMSLSNIIGGLMLVECETPILTSGPSQVEQERDTLCRLPDERASNRRASYQPCGHVEVCERVPRNSELGSRISVPRTPYPVLSTWYLVLGTRYSVLGTGPSVGLEAHRTPETSRAVVLTSFLLKAHPKPLFRDVNCTAGPNFADIAWTGVVAVLQYRSHLFR